MSVMEVHGTTILITSHVLKHASRTFPINQFKGVYGNIVQKHVRKFNK